MFNCLFKKFCKNIDKHCDIILVGDSMANVLYGMENTHKIKLDTIIQHTVSVKKGIRKSLLVVDMPKGSYKNPFQAKLFFREKKLQKTCTFWTTKILQQN